MKFIWLLVVPVEIVFASQAFASMKCFKAFAAAAALHVGGGSSVKADIYPDFSEEMKKMSSGQTSSLPAGPWDSLALLPGFRYEPPLRHTLDIDLMKLPLLNSEVELAGKTGDAIGKNFFLPPTPQGERTVLRDNRGVGIQIISSQGRMKTKIVSSPLESGMQVEKEGAAELFLTWAGTPKADSTKFLSPEDYHGFQAKVDLTERGGDRFVIKHSGAPATVRFRVYPNENAKEFWEGQVELPQTGTPTEFYLPFSQLQLTGKKQTGTGDFSSVSAVSVKYLQKTGSLPYYQLNPCTGNCEIQNIPAEIPSQIHYVGVAGPDHFPSIGGGTGPTVPGHFPPILDLLPPAPPWTTVHTPWHLPPPSLIHPPHHPPHHEPPPLDVHDPMPLPPDPGQTVVTPAPPAIVLIAVAAGVFGTRRYVVGRSK